MAAFGESGAVIIAALDKDRDTEVSVRETSQPEHDDSLSAHGSQLNTFKDGKHSDRGNTASEAEGDNLN